MSILRERLAQGGAEYQNSTKHTSLRLSAVAYNHSRTYEITC
jgi:hypothetical protein